MDLARAPQTAGGPAHDLVDFRPVRREPSLPQHPFLDPRHGDDTGAGSIRGTARVRVRQGVRRREEDQVDRKSTRLNSSHGYISYAVFCLKKKNKQSLVTIEASLTKLPFDAS